MKKEYYIVHWDSVLVGKKGTEAEIRMDTVLCDCRQYQLQQSVEQQTNNKMFSLKIHIILNTSENNETACM